MKKFFLSFAALAVAMTLGFTSCGEKDTPDPEKPTPEEPTPDQPTPDQPEEPEEPEELPIVLDFHNSDMHANMLFVENPIVTGSNYTMEIKFYATHWHPYDQADPEFGDDKVYCNRLAGFNNADESLGFLYRYGDGGKNGSLRLNSGLLNTANGADYIGGQDRVWDLNMWHTVTVAVDPTTCTVYDNGEVVGTVPVANPDGYEYCRHEFGMTWDDGTGYVHMQDFHGYVAYVRFWTKTLSQDEVKAGLCHVDHNAEGLEACWEMCVDGGSVIPDVTGHGRDWDWSKAYMMNMFKPEDKSDILKSQWYDWDEEEKGPLCAE